MTQLLFDRPPAAAAAAGACANPDQRWHPSVCATGEPSSAAAGSDLRRRFAHRYGAKPLTPAQLTVALLVAEGRTNEQIARELGSRLDTIKNHTAAILKKTACRSRWLFIARHGGELSPTESQRLESELFAKLTLVERRVAMLLAQGLATKIIADRLGRAYGTIKHQTRSVITKSGCSTRLAFVVRYGGVFHRPACA